MNGSFAAPATSSFTRARKALGALRGLNRDPNRLDLVFVLGETVNRSAFPRVWSSFEDHPQGARVLRDRPAIDSAHVDLEALARLPDGTLGREYVRFLHDNGLTLDVFKAPEGVDPRIAYLVQRVRQTHDLWHVVTGYKPDIPGEVLLQAFTFSQLHTPSSLLIALIGSARIAARGKLRFLPRVARAFRHGARARNLAPMYWEELWALPVARVRELVECPVAS